MNYVQKSTSTDVSLINMIITSNLRGNVKSSSKEDLKKLYVDLLYKIQIDLILNL